ncbi:MAG: diguanylate cyclase [Gammaproteobacteria bacterium RIFCSPHIGHO2_12_FULL_41_15]|nr:MAG: diguanylate cyclase [Gammaproteobacteria bacterium RIFCSPHIGHO2_12_FULL_41_15]
MNLMIKKLKLDNNKAIVIANHHGIINFVNDAFEHLFIWSFKEIINQSLLAIIPSHLHDAHNLGFSRFISTEEPILLNNPLNLPALTKDGKEFKAVHLIRAIKENDQWIIGANIYLSDQ